MRKNNGIIITSIIAVVILVIVILVLGAFRSMNPYSKNTVSAEGISKVKATPDLVSVYINIKTNGTTSSTATAENTKVYNKLVEELISAGFEEKDLKTESFSVYEDISWDSKDQKSKKEGYIAYHSLKIELDSAKMDKVSKIIDAAVNAEAGISYINFELTQKSQNEYKAQALKEASQDAMVKAGAIASGLNKKLGKLLSVQTSDFGYSPWNIYTARSLDAGYGESEALMAKEATINIQPGEEEIYATVTAIFQMK